MLANTKSIQRSTIGDKNRWIWCTSKRCLVVVEIKMAEPKFRHFSFRSSLLNQALVTVAIALAT